jgi:hypothetical protein
MLKTRKCARCNESFYLVLRGGRNSGKAKAGRRHTHHKGRRYCSDTCRKLASKGRRKSHQSSPERAAKPLPATTPLSTVTTASSRLDISRGYRGRKSGRAWRQIAGPEPSPSQFHCATVPDGGAYKRIEAENRAMLKAHFAKLAKECLIQPHHPPVNIVGGYRFADAPAIGFPPAVDQRRQRERPA